MSAPKEVVPWPSQVDGSHLLSELSCWFLEYLYLPERCAHAISAWAVLTWFRERVHFAPILAVLSPTKRCGKTTLFDLLSGVVCTPVLSSAFGSTPATVFRLNEALSPTLLIDEAEKLGEGGDIVSLLNNGYRRGSKVHRCREKSGAWEVEDYDAFGFRAVAAIGELWDTLTDRAITIRLQRRPSDVIGRRFLPREVDEESGRLASMVARFAQDRGDDFAAVLATVDFPACLNDRERDNWSGLLAVADIAGGEWPSLLAEAALGLCAGAEASDERERLIGDLYRVFCEQGWPEGLPSGAVAETLNAIDDAPWGDRRGGRGLSAHALTRMLRPFGVDSREGRTAARKIRGFWLDDLRPVFERYLPEVGQSGQAKYQSDSDRPSLEAKSGAEVRRQDASDSSAGPTRPTSVGEVAHAPR